MALANADLRGEVPPAARFPHAHVLLSCVCTRSRSVHPIRAGSPTDEFYGTGARRAGGPGRRRAHLVATSHRWVPTGPVRSAWCAEDLSSRRGSRSNSFYRSPIMSTVGSYIDAAPLPEREVVAEPVHASIVLPPAASIKNMPVERCARGGGGHNASATAALTARPRRFWGCRRRRCARGLGGGGPSFVDPVWHD